MDKAAKAAASFLLLVPDHEDMKENMAYYRQAARAREEWFQPR